MARFASASELGLLEPAAVGVHVAVLAIAEHEAFEENRLPLGMGFVAFLARDGLMLSGEGVFGLAMVKTGHRFPGILGMAARTVVSFLTLVDVLMAGITFAAET